MNHVLSILSILTVFCLCHLHVHGEDSDVIIVGAGLAGLAAAEKLIYYGYSVTILEAQDRIGGRVKTEKEYFSNIAVDLGAQWVYGHINNTMADIVERVTGHHLVTKSDDARYYDNDIELESSDITEIKHMYSKLITKLEEEYDGVLNGNDEDLALSDALDAVFDLVSFDSEDERYVNSKIVRDIELEYGTSCEDLSTKHYKERTTLSGRDWWLEGGFSQVVDYLATSEMNILLSRQVSSIDYNDEKVVVTTTDGDIFKSKHVIVTVPLGVLKNNKITFSPELPTNYQSAINSLNMGVVDKHVLQFSEVFWPTDAEFFYLINEGSSRYELSQYYQVHNMEYHIPGSKILVVYESGRSADQSEDYSDNERMANVLKHLRTVWDEATVPESYLLTNWGNDPYTYGSISSYGVDSKPHDRAIFNNGIDSKLYFAGTTHGAYLSGMKAAEYLVQDTGVLDDDDYDLSLDHHGSISEFSTILLVAFSFLFIALFLVTYTMACGYLKCSSCAYDSVFEASHEEEYFGKQVYKNEASPLIVWDAAEDDHIDTLDDVTVVHGSVVRNGMAVL